MSTQDEQASQKLNWLDEVKQAGADITRRRLEDDGVDFHAERNAVVNAMEGVAPSTPVTKAALANPSDPGQANFQTSVTHTGPKNVHSPTNTQPTDLSQLSADQANKKGTNTTPSKS